MPLTRKQQILAKLETSEGVDSSPAAADAMLVFDPTIADDVANTDRVPAGATLSRDFVPMGRKSRTMTFTSDFRGSADTSIPITVPDWGTLLQACAYKSVTPIRLPITSPTGTGFQLGEIVQKSSTIRGVVIGLINTLVVPNFVTHRLSSAGDVVVAPIQGTFTSSGTLTGESSGTTATLGTVANYPGLAYMPTSEKVVTLTVSSWSSSAPAVGDVLRVRNGSVVVGHAQIIAENSVGTMLDFDVTLLAGTIATGNTLATADTGGSTATIATGPTQKRTPSLSFRHNLDGRRRGLVGARGDFELRGDSGGPLSFSWTFNGEATASLDAVPVATSGLSSIRPPRLLGAIVAVGRTVNTTLGDSAVDFFRLPTKSVGLQAGNTVAPNLDANAANGSTGANVTDRDPQISATIDQIHGGFDWEDFRDNARACRIAVQCGGNTPGQIVGFVAPNVQVLEAAVADADGVAAWDLNMRPRRVLESGDDEVVIYQI